MMIGLVLSAIVAGGTVDEVVLTVNEPVDAIGVHVQQKILGADVPGEIQGLKFVSLTKTSGDVSGEVFIGGHVHTDPWLLMEVDVPDHSSGNPIDTTCVHGACAEEFNDVGKFAHTWSGCQASSHVLYGGSWTDNLLSDWMYDGTFGIDVVTSAAGATVSVGSFDVETVYTMAIRYWPDDQDSDGDVDGDDVLKYARTAGSDGTADAPEDILKVLAGILDAYGTMGGGS